MLKWLWLSLIVIGLDQYAKYIASTELQYNVPVEVMPSFNWLLAHNTGAAFSFLSDASGWQRWFFVILTIVVGGMIIVWLRKLTAGQGWLAAALALILGGAVGNVIDRLWHGYVIDFIQWYYGSYYWPSFNIADSAIMLGAAILIIDGIFSIKRDEKS